MDSPRVSEGKEKEEEEEEEKRRKLKDKKKKRRRKAKTRVLRVKSVNTEQHLARLVLPIIHIPA